MIGLLRTAALWPTRRRSARDHVFITGAPRSGTTLLKTILVAHPRLAGGDYESTGIFKPRDLYAYACGEIGLNEMRHLLDRSSDLIAFYDGVADQLLRYYGGERFIDKIWPQWYRLFYVRRHFPNARWVHIVRDGRDCYCSALHHPHIPQTQRLDVFARYWQRSVRLIESMLEEAVCFSLRYEDLTADPEGETRRLMEALGESFDPAQLNASRRAGTTTMGRKSVHARLGQPIDSQSVSRWRNELSDEENAAFVRVAGDVLRAWRYV